MAKIIIPRSELPNLSQEGVNRFRYRVINKNRNLTSQWSVIGNIKRPEETIDYELPDTFTVSPADNHLLVVWEDDSNVYAEYEVYYKEYFSTFDFRTGNTNYNSDTIKLSEVTDKSNSFVYGSFSSKVGISPPVPEGAQVMIRNYRYPRIEKQAWNILQAEIKSNVLKIYIEPNVTDFDNINNSSGYIYADVNVVDLDNRFTSAADMELFSSIMIFTDVDKSNPSYTVLSKSVISPDITMSNPYGSIQRIDHDPLFVSDYVDWT